MNGKILFDWISFTSKIDSPESIIDNLGLGDLEWIIVERNAHGFARRYYFNGINVHYDNPKFDGVWVEMSGQGCRAFDEYSKIDWSILFSLILEHAPLNEYHLTRLDVAYDDKEGLLNLDKIFKETLNQNYISRFEAWECTKSNKGITIYIGSMKSEIMFRIYDKAKERKREDEGHWVRFEMQLRDERALEFIRKLINTPIGELFGGVLNNYITYVIPNKNDRNKRRWNSQRWWKQFTENARQISLWTPCDTGYNLMQCENYVYKIAGNAIHTLMEIEGNEAFYKKLLKNKAERVNPKYQSLIAEYGTKASRNV